MSAEHEVLKRIADLIAMAFDDAQVGMSAFPLCTFDSEGCETVYLILDGTSVSVRIRIDGVENESLLAELQQEVADALPAEWRN